MSIALEAILFNCHPGIAGITALNLRKNAVTPVLLPEWQAGTSVSSVHSPAAYATAEAWGRPVLIQARFRQRQSGLRTFEVRAVPDTRARVLWAAWEPLAAVPDGLPAVSSPHALWRSLAAAEDHVLGEVKARWITVPPSGETGFETFEVADHRLWSAGVGVHAIGWRWQYREASGLPWTDFAVTRHRIYLLLEVPKLPWLQVPATVENTQLPWTDVLDYACHWAAGARSRAAVSRAITAAVFSLGPTVVQYGCPIFALTQYSLLYFDCTAFLERLAGGYGNGPYVNCSDCATVVSTFANILGCDFWQSRMGPALGTFFETNPIRVIGYPQFTIPCGIATGFQYHEVAWTGACGFDEPVSDACLLVNASLNPALPPYLPLLPTNLRFAGGIGYDYRGRLASAAGLLNCVPQPLTRQRRFVV